MSKLNLIKITDEKDSDDRILGLYKCDCGNEKLISIRNVLSNKTKSCGCLNKANIESTIKYLYNRYKFKAKEKGLSFNISLEQFKIITSENCHYCKIEPSQKAENNNIVYAYNGIDRKDNNVGYELENSLPCCKVCNRAKNSMKYEEFIEYLDRIFMVRNEKNGPISDRGVPLTEPTKLHPFPGRI